MPPGLAPFLLDAPAAYRYNPLKLTMDGVQFAGRIAGFAFLVFSAFLAAGHASAQESFEGHPGGPATNLDTLYGRLEAAEGHMSLISGGRSGAQALHVEGGEGKTVELVLDEPPQEDATIHFWLQRATPEAPFLFTVEALDEAGRPLATTPFTQAETDTWATGVKAPLPAGTARMRLSCNSPAGAGANLDDMSISGGTLMKTNTVEVRDPGTLPAMKNRAYNPVYGIHISTTGSLQPKRLTQVRVRFSGSPGDIEAVALHVGSADPSNLDVHRRTFGPPLRPEKDKEELVFTGDMPLRTGENWLWVSITPSAKADIRHTLSCVPFSLSINNKPIALSAPAARPQRIGSAVCTSGNMGAKYFRLPGVIRTREGTLVACFDARYNHGGNLPANIDIAFSRSEDGGQTWSPAAIAMDTGNNPEAGYDGCGDPCILQDTANGRIWIAALWVHGNWGHAFNGSRPGMTPEETGQWVMVFSDDDGRTWSRDIVNITPQIKKPEWRLVLPGPGRGICTTKGILVFPAQYRGAENAEEQGKPFATVCTSSDGGRTWRYGTGVRADTTESQVVELKDGSLMLNCKDNRGAYRTVAVTRDLGRTWSAHPSDRKELIDPICQASLIAVDHTPQRRRLYFSNPCTPGGRYNLSIRVSRDEGKSWSEPRTCDYRTVPGHSCLVPIDDQHLGLMYESNEGINFLALPYAELDGESAGSRSAARK